MEVNVSGDVIHLHRDERHRMRRRLTLSSTMIQASVGLLCKATSSLTEVEPIISKRSQGG